VDDDEKEKGDIEENGVNGTKDIIEEKVILANICLPE